MNSRHRVIIATDIPFWMQANGAHQRVSAIARGLRTEPFALTVFYLGSQSDDVLHLASERGIELELFQREQAGGIFSSALSTLDKLRGRSRPANDTPRDSSLTLSDYAWPAARRQFAKMLRRLDPRTVILEYVTMAYLAHVAREAAPRARLVLDSHDVLHRRCAQFTAAGYRHWLQISEREEIDAARQFDLILAIQDDEASWFRGAAPRSTVLTVGHSFDFEQIQPVWRTQADLPVVVGYFGSHNGSNIDAVSSFVESAWPQILKQRRGAIELLIGGTIADAPLVQRCAEVPAVRVQRNFLSPSAFYQAVDMVINPVRFGTGLKIKSVEALAHGKPVLTTSSGRVGIASIGDDACFAVDSIEDMVPAIVEWSSDRARLVQCGQQAYQLARVEFSEQNVLGEFRRLLLEEYERPRAKSPFSGQKMLE